MNSSEVDGSDDAHEGQDEYKEASWNSEEGDPHFPAYQIISRRVADRGSLGLFWKF